MNTTSEVRLKGAAQEGDINLLYAVIQDYPYVLEKIDSVPFVETPLHIAASVGHVQFATEIMRLKPSFSRKLNQQGLSPIHLAMQQGQTEMVFRFIKINKNLVRVKGKEGLTSLHLASETGQVELLANFLLACPESIEDVTVRSETAFHIAVKCQQLQAFQVLVGWHNKFASSNAMTLEEILNWKDEEGKTVLNWKDEAGNTVLHVSALMNDTQAIQLLLKKTTKMELNTKNLDNLTALDIAGSAEIATMLSKAGAKSGSSVIDAPTLADKMKSKITISQNFAISKFHIRRNMTEDERNALLVVAALIATATYQTVLSPPGGVYQANAGDTFNNSNTAITSSFNSSSMANATTTQAIAGISVLSESDFNSLFSFNTLCLLISTSTILILTPAGMVGTVLLSPMIWFVISYIISVKLISPTSLFSLAVAIFPQLLFVLVFCLSYASMYTRYWSLRKRENKTTNNNVAQW